MRTSAIFVAAAAAVASAQYTEENGTFKCEKPNTNYCLAGDIILRCDANGKGTPGRCSANLSGYPPMGGVASCYESADGAGDAACEKNCIVYANPAFTLGADVCEPSYTSTAVESTLSTIVTHATTSTEPTTTTTYVNPSQTTEEPTTTIIHSTTGNNYTRPGHQTTIITYTNSGNGGHKTRTITYVNPTQPANDHTKTTTITYTNPTRPGDCVTKTMTYVHPTEIPTNYTTIVNPPKPTHHGGRPSPSGKPTGHPGNSTCTDCNGGSGGKGGDNGNNGGNGGNNGGSGSNGGSNGGSGSATRTPVSPTVEPTSVPTAGAAINTVSGLLAAVGFVAAYLL